MKQSDIETEGVSDNIISFIMIDFFLKSLRKNELQLGKAHEVSPFSNKLSETQFILKRPKGKGINPN